MAPPAAVGASPLAASDESAAVEKEISAVSSLADMHTTAPKMSRPVYLVGTVNLANEEEVFRTVSTIVGEHMDTITDGETGKRLMWILTQVEVLARCPELHVVGEMKLDYGGLAIYRLRPDADPLSIKFDNLGIADATIASYQTFAKLKDEGVIAPATRFRVNLPTPTATVGSFVDVGSQSAVEPPYEAAVLAELDRICAAIPHDQVTIQWDTAVEFAFWEGLGSKGWEWYVDAPDVHDAIIERMVRISRRVPTAVPLGYHFCYGDLGGKHFVQPTDMGNLVAVANRISQGLTRPIKYFHMPVPIDRKDETYFSPLENLKLHPETELYLGLVHLSDGVEGAKRRIEAARKFAPRNFGVGTECGLGRKPVETIAPLLELHRTVATTTI